MTAVVVADLLGLSIHTATRWAELTGQRWSGYIAHRDNHEPIDPGRGSSRP